MFLTISMWNQSPPGAPWMVGVLYLRQASWAWGLLPPLPTRSQRQPRPMYADAWLSGQ